MPRYLSNSLPPLPEGGEARVPTPGDSRMSDLLGRGGAKRESASRARRDSKNVKAIRRREAPGAGFPWWLGVLAALCAGVLTLVAVLSWNRLRTPADKMPRAGGSAAGSAPAPNVIASGAGTVTVPPGTKLRTPSDEAIEDLRLKAHGKGTKDSPELNAWVDHQAALQAKLLQTGKCEGSAAACQILYRPGEDTSVTGRITPRKPSSPKAVRSRWMAGLRMPSIPVEDDIRVQRIFERLTDTPTGREQVAQILFRCGAYKDLIQATLIRYDLPPSLLAVVFAESGCSPTIKSPVGAEGLWQFMPESGRAYHLHITEDVLDERHSPQKSTEAAIHFLADLYAKFGSWDLAFAAYNMGPYGLYARQQRAGGGDVGFWELLDADLLPGETSNYVPIIEAYALILENLQKLKFASVQMRSPEVTADLDAPPGTRIGLIARAASTSTNQIRALNLDLKADVIPTIPGQRFSVQVPHDSVWQARDQLDELIAQGTYDDQCVADNFDWGKQVFTKDMRDECRRRLGAPAGRPSHTP